MYKNTHNIIISGALSAMTAMALMMPSSATAQEAEAVSVQSIGAGVAVGEKVVEVTPHEMTVSMDIVLDSLRLRSTKRLVLTPAVKGVSEERLLPQVVINGRRQYIEYKRKGHKKYDEDAISVRRKNGTEQTVQYSAVLPYEAWMWNSDVVIGEDLCGCGTLIGSDAASVWRVRTARVAYIRPEAKPKTYDLKGTAYIDFPVDKTTIYPDYRRNPEELQKIIGTIMEVKKDGNVTVNSVDICGYASPESPYEHNEYLAATRAQTLSNYVKQLVSLDKARFTVSSVAENWEGLRKCVAESSLANKDAILALIDDEKTYTPDAKEWKIKTTYPDDYAYMLKEFYPGLRRSDYTVNYTIRSFSLDEAKEMYKSDPRKLSLEELYMVAQTYETGSEEFTDVFATAVHNFPDDETANLNAGCAEIESGDIDAAERYLAKAGETAEAMNARGVVAVQKGDSETAVQMFRKASDMGLEIAKENLKMLDTSF
ncbi:MAG: DUF3868 domain-containing protein [Prevotella sp.]|nr:DUF3868 domain-containing protein [Prevotella sp.]